MTHFSLWSYLVKFLASRILVSSCIYKIEEEKQICRMKTGGGGGGGGGVGKEARSGSD